MRKRIIYPIFAFLLAVTIFQAAVLVNYHATGSLFNFNNNKGPQTVTNIKEFEEYLTEEYVTPFEITVTAGEGLSVYKVSRSGEKYFTEIWKDSITVLKDISESPLYEMYDETKWNEMTGRSGVIIKFGYDCPISFINWISDSVNTNSGLKSINKFMIVPTEGTEGDVYVRSGDAVYRYIGVELNGVLSNEKFLSLYQNIKDSSEFTYAYMTEVSDYDTYKGNVEPDIAVNIEADSAHITKIRVAGFELLTECMFNLEIEPDITDLSSVMEQYISTIKTRLFGVYADVYMSIIGQNRDLTFSDQYNIYNIHNDGSISYRYTSSSGDAKGDISTAFTNALSMVTDLLSLSTLGEIHIYLTDVTETDEAYTFSFSYLYNDYPVLTEDDGYAITVNATAKRVVSLDAVLYDISDASSALGETDLYDIRTFDLLSNAGMADLGQLKAENMYMAYIKNDLIVLSPSWIIDDEDMTVLTLTEKEAE
jgi:hypothetical protein